MRRTRNQRPFYYCLYQGRSVVTDPDDYETGEERVTYAEPVEMLANISPARGYAQTEQFGNFADYDKVIVTVDTGCPIDENTVLFVDKEPEFSTLGDPMYDYIVRRVAKSINNVAIAISKVSVS